MRRGNDPRILYNKRGEIFAISTGSDATTEHECGSQPLQDALCQLSGTRPRAPEGMFGKLAVACGIRSATIPTDIELIGDLRKGKAVTYPPLLARKTLNQNLDKLVFLTGTDKNGQPVAMLGFAPYPMTLDHPELRFYREEDTVAGAWDDRSFALKVRGERLVGKLQRFAAALQAGEGVFAGLFLADQPKEPLAGVIIALSTGLRPEHKQVIAKAQADWEAGLRLKAKSRLDELHALFRQNRGQRPNVRLPGYLWPVWRDQVVDGEVVYALNPDNGVKASYWGPYSFEDLQTWILAESKPALQPLAKPVAA